MRTCQGEPAGGPVAAAEVCLGRQPIYTYHREIRAYELLYRSRAAENFARISDPDEASAEVVLRAFVEIGLQRVSPSRPVFINHTRRLLDMDPIIPADRCVIEVLENIEPDEGTIRALRRLRGLGYRIALDDFIAGDPRFVLVGLADFVKVDARLVTGLAFRDVVARLRAFPAVILAEKVETEAEFQQFHEWGCELFQGYYLRAPENITGRRTPSNRLSVLALLAECTDEAESADAVAAVIRRDATLSYDLLRLANSATFAHRAEVRSIPHAVAMLGLDAIFRWCVLLALARYDDCPAGYLEFALERARAAELLAISRDYPRYEAYIAGLVSTLDAILNTPLDGIVEPLPLDAGIKNAVLRREGALGAVLNAVIAQESGEFDTAAAQGFPAGEVQHAFWEAAEYAAEMLSGLPRGSAPS